MIAKNRPARRTWLALLGLALLAMPPALPAAPAAARLPVLVVRLLPGTEPAILEQLEHVRLAKGAEAPSLQLDMAHRRVLDGAGRVVAGADAIGSIYLQSVVDKWRYIVALRALSRAHPQEIRSEWGDDGSPQAAPRPWVVGTTATFRIPHVALPRELVVFGMGPNGHLYLLEVDTADGEDEVIARAVPPLGAEHIVAVSAADHMGIHALTVWLAEGNEGRGPGLIDTQGEILAQIAGLKEVRVGVVGAYSCNTAKECVR